MQSGRVPFRVQGSRKFILGSLAGHVGITLLFSIMGAALLSPPPPLQLVKVNLQTLELPREITPDARLSISSAARRVKVSNSIFSGGTPCAIRYSLTTVSNQL